MKIYTRTGDKGETSLFTGERVSKTHPCIEALGSIDECNSAIGMTISTLPGDKGIEIVKKQLIAVQHALFDLGAAVATPVANATERQKEKTTFDEEAVSSLEEWVDEYDQKLPKLKNFIIPGGHPSAATLHLARSFCRRAEREIVQIVLDEEIPESVLIYLNRLSDYLFVAARYITMISGEEETIWESSKQKEARNNHAQ